MNEHQELITAGKTIAACIEAREQLKGESFFRVRILLDMLICELERSMAAQHEAATVKQSERADEFL